MSGRLATKALWKTLAPVFGLEGRRITSFTLEMSTNAMPCVTITEIPDAATEPVTKRFSLSEIVVNRRRHVARKILTGDKELEKTLKHLADKSADRVARSVLGAGLTVINKAQRAAAPVGPTGNLKANIGKRNERNKRKGVFEAKTGIGVGKQKRLRAKGIGSAPHGHLVALGTKPRFRKSIGGKFGYIQYPTQEQLSTGTMPSNPFIKQAYQSARGAAQAKMKTQAEKALAREATKAKAK